MQIYHLKLRKLKNKDLFTIGEPKQDELVIILLRFYYFYKITNFSFFKLFYSVNDIIEYFTLNEIAIKNAGKFLLRLEPNLKEIHHQQKKRI